MPLQGNLSIEHMCQLVGVSRRSFYRALKEGQPAEEEMEVRAAIQQIFLEHRVATAIGELRPNSTAVAGAVASTHRRIHRAVLRPTALGYRSPDEFERPAVGSPARSLGASVDEGA